MSVVLVGSYPLGDINVAASGAVVALAPLLVEVDLMLTGSFGLGSLLVDLSAQLNAALAAQVSLSLQVSNPFASLKAQLAALLQIQASIQATLSLGLPAVSVTIGANIAAAAAISATLTARVGGIRALIEAALAVKIPVVNLLGQLTAALSVGPVELLSFGFDAPNSLADVGAGLSSRFAAGLPGVAPGDNVQGVVLLTKSPSAAAAMSFLLKVA